MKIHDIKPSEMARAANISLYEWNRKMNKIEAAEIFFDEKLQKRK